MFIFNFMVMNASKISDFITNWLTEYLKNSGLKGFVVGVSGGIDSAVTSTLCAKTNFPTLCLQMPIHQDINQVNNASEHIKNLQKNYKNVFTKTSDLTNIFEAFQKIFPHEKHPNKELTLANTRARIRMTTLYYWAGIHNFLVAGTGNKIEDFAVGFFTKYGDGGVDMSPIADLVKSEVFALGAYLKVPKSILEAAPTDGLFGDQRTDAEQLGASYEELEWAMDFLKNKTKNTEKINNRQKKVLEIYKKLHLKNKHKMQPIPVCEVPQKCKEN